MDLELRPIVEDEFPAFNRAVATAFGAIPTDEELESWQVSLAADRTLAGFDGGAIVATAGACTFRLTVPGGGQVATAGVTVVGVHPTHRRRGLLARMMDEQLDDVASRGEPLAVLTASESSIYGRFGYGLATFSAWWQLATDHARLADAPTATGRIRLVHRDAAPAIAQAVFDAARVEHVGEVTREPVYWERVYRERRGPASPQSDGKPFFTVVHENDAGRPDAFARYRIVDNWAHGQPANELRVLELHATDAESEAAVWSYLLGVDLVATIKADDRPVDEELRWRLTDPRRLQVTQVTDHLWVRMVDVAAALSARTYSVDDALVLGLTDRFRPANDGAWLVEGGPDGATCARTDHKPDLWLSAPDLGTLYLGGVDATVLARAGRVREATAGALTRADRFFRSHPAPWCSTHF